MMSSRKLNIHSKQRVRIKNNWRKILFVSLIKFWEVLVGKNSIIILIASLITILVGWVTLKDRFTFNTIVSLKSNPKATIKTDTFIKNVNDSLSSLKSKIEEKAKSFPEPSYKINGLKKKEINNLLHTSKALITQVSGLNRM